MKTYIVSLDFVSIDKSLTELSEFTGIQISSSSYNKGDVHKVKNEYIENTFIRLDLPESESFDEILHSISDFFKSNTSMISRDFDKIVSIGVLSDNYSISTSISSQFISFCHEYGLNIEMSFYLSES